MHSQRLKYQVFKFLFIVLFSWGIQPVWAQVPPIKQIQKALEKENYTKAETILTNRVEQYFKESCLDSIVDYVYWSGRIFADQKEIDKGSNAVEALIGRLKQSGISTPSLVQSYIEAGEYYEYTGDNRKGYECNQLAYETGVKSGINSEKLAKIQNNMAVFAHRNGDISLMNSHSKKVIRLLAKATNPDYITLYNAQNMIGTSLFFKSEIDSAAYYFEAALTSLKKAEPTPQNKYYRVATIQNNLAAIYNMQGHIQKAVDTMYAVIQNIGKYTQLEEDGYKKSKALSFEFEAIDNLAGMYKELGNLTRAEELLKYSYQQKQTKLKSDNRGAFNSEILLGSLYYAMIKYDKALEYTKLGLKHFAEADTDDPLWTGDGYNTLSLVYDAKMDDSTATAYYHLADSMYAAAFDGDFDQIYLDFLRNKTRFFAERGQYEQAGSMANKSYRYIVQAQGEESMEAFYQLLNLSSVAYLAGNYRRAESYASQGLSLLYQKMSKASTLGDSIKMELYKPRAILYKVRSQYRAMAQPTEPVVKGFLTELYDAIKSIEKKKEFAAGEENNRIILAENKELFDFIKKLELELYRLTGDETYIDRMMNVEESVLYSKIRARLQDDTQVQFAQVPLPIRTKETELRLAVKNALATGHSTHAVAQYKNAVDRLADYRKMLREKYPDYYQLKYRSFLSEPVDYKSTVRAGTSVVRYFFVDTALYALVIDSQAESLILLNGAGLKEKITQLHNPATSVQDLLHVLNGLYTSLWKPFEDKIKYKKVVIIPDGILYSLNMEMLASEPVNSYKELTQKSLLARYTISYQYTLSLMNAHRADITNRVPWIGFAPGFTDDLKKSYARSVQDSVMLDMGYLTMLPQPFTATLLKKIKRLYGGEVFLNESSTKEQFLKSAGHSSIIHIGSHAFSDNQNPQYSRIVFAKSREHTPDNNLYVHNIYNYNIPARLTVLSACETGVTGYEDGEGMISLAHAFYFAGSESILTSLWEIDEKAGSIILESFYRHLRNGEDKDEALRQAKLDYLASACGRDLSPLYWSGLIIMGDTSPIALPSGHSSMLPVWIGVALLALIAFIVFWIRKRRRSDISV